MNISLSRNKLFSLGIYLVVFLSFINPYRDNDWGWHYKYGEYFVNSGQLLLKDPFSWTLPGYSWTNHSWAYDVLLYYLYSNLGWIGLSIIGAIIGFMAFYFITRTFKLNWWKLGILGAIFVAFTHVAMFAALRSQVVSLLFFSLLLYLLSKARQNKKWIWGLPFLFLFWVNMHGDFTLGLLVSAIFLLFYGISTKSILKFLFPLGVAVLATLLNPFTLKAYQETLLHLTNPYQKNVIEWLSIFDNCQGCFPYLFVIYTVVLGILFIVALKRRYTYLFPYFIVGLVLFVPALQTRRLMPIFTLLTLPIIAYYLENLKWRFEKFAISTFVAWLIIIVGIEYNLSTRFTRDHIYNFTEEHYATLGPSCSKKVVDYMLENPPQGKGFNFYDCGGYLIGKGIDTKLFIDGRMHVWQENNYQPFADYIKMYYLKDYDLFKTYDFDWLLIKSDSDLASAIVTRTDLGNWKLENTSDNISFFQKQR